MNCSDTLTLGSIIFEFTKSKVLWDIYEIRSLLLLSLGAQTILSIFGNRRRYRLRYVTRFFLWLSYLISSPIVTLALGKLSGMTGKAYDVNDVQGNIKLEKDGGLSYVLNWFSKDWFASLLLVQIGSPNVISYSVEDNKLKLRQVIGLTSQVAIAFWIFYVAWDVFPSLITSLPLYVAGIIKVGERLQALCSLNNSEKVVITSLANSDNQKAEIFPAEPNILSGTYSHHLALLVKAYQRFDRLKPYLENWLGCPSSIYLPSMTVDDYPPKDVFTVTEIELSLMYDVLCTKAPINYSKRSFGGRIICILVLLYILVLILCLSKISDLRLDGQILLVLIVGAIVLEIYEVKELLFSDWAILYLTKQNRSAFMRRLMLRIVAPKVLRKKHRWSHRMDQLNLLSYCLYKHPTKLGDFVSSTLKVKGYDKVYKYCVKKDIQVPEELKELILEQIREVRAQSSWQSFSKSGEWALEKCNCLQDLEWSFQTDDGTQAKTQTNFGKAIFIWHIATTVCYDLNDDQEGTINQSEHEMSKVSKVLSDYMMYLLSMNSDMLSIVTGDVLFRGVCAQVGVFLKTRQSRDEATFCSRILVDDLVDENYFQGIPKNVLTSEWNVLLEAQKLTRILREKEDRWRIISSVWVEMLCYSATNCPWTLHADQLRRGGELLTHVWLLLEHEKDQSNVPSRELQSIA